MKQFFVCAVVVVVAVRVAQLSSDLVINPREVQREKERERERPQTTEIELEGKNSTEKQAK